jgi:hypothetical protein
MARAIAMLVTTAALLAGGQAWAGTWEERRGWDWGQHRTSLFAEDAPWDRVPPARSHDHWDDPAAPVRVADR